MVETQPPHRLCADDRLRIGDRRLQRSPLDRSEEERSLPHETLDRPLFRLSLRYYPQRVESSLRQFAGRFCIWEFGAPGIAAQLVRGRAHVVLRLFSL